MSDDKDDEIAKGDQSKALSDHMATLEHAETAVAEALTQIRKIRVDYAKAEEQRQQQRAKS